jgi:hypothetical protein
LPAFVQEKVVVSHHELLVAKLATAYLIDRNKQLLEQQLSRIQNTVNIRKNDTLVWVPYGQILAESLPAQRGIDNRFTNRLFSLLSIITISKSHLRPKLVCGSESYVIAMLEDLSEVLHITQNMSGIPEHKLRFYEDTFLKLYRSKYGSGGIIGNTDSGGEMSGLTTRELSDFYNKENNGKKKPISPDNLKKSYLEELMNNNYIGAQRERGDSGKYYFYSLIEMEDEQDIPRNRIKDVPETETNEDKQFENITNSSKSKEFDDLFHFKRIQLPKNCINIPENWLLFGVLGIANYRIDLGKMQGCIADFLNNHNDFKLIDKHGNRLSIKQFLDEYEFHNTRSLIRYFKNDKSCKFDKKVFGNLRYFGTNCYHKK